MKKVNEKETPNEEVNEEKRCSRSKIKPNEEGRCREPPFLFLKNVPEKNLRADPPKGVSWRPRNGLVAFKKNMKKPNEET